MMSADQQRIAMVDSGHNVTSGWRPSTYLRTVLGRTRLDYLFVTNADQDHLSDLEGLWDQFIDVGTLYRNRQISADDLREIKEQQGECTNDIERFLEIHESFVGEVTVPFDQGMGVRYKGFTNPFPMFQDTNNLSLAAFFQLGHFKILFPGDLEKDGWLELLKRRDFIDELATTTILCASHHGRENGFCEEIFNHFTPSAVVISDKPIAHSTQEMVPDYRAVVQDNGVLVASQGRRRHVLTTRRDGDILFTVQPNGDYRIDTYPT